MLKVNLISERYKNDGMSLMPLNQIQVSWIKRFQEDDRIKYNELKKCPLCQYENFILIAEKDRYGISLKTVVCEKCGLIFTLNRMIEQSTSIFYSEYYRKIYEGEEVASKKFLAQKYKDRSIGKIPKFLDKDDVVVEIGTGGGWNLMKYKLHGYNHYGFDYDENYINFGKEKYALNLYNGGVQEAKKTGLSADYILLLHVLEHTINPLKFLSELRDIMKDEAILNVLVPSLNYLIIGGGATGYDLLGTLQNAHNFLFDEFVLKYFALQAGYNIKILIGGNIVLTKSSNTNYALKKIENKLNNSFRGHKIVKYLKLCESLVAIKNNIMSHKLISDNCGLYLQYLYFILKPLEIGKKYLMYRKGITF